MAKHTINEEELDKFLSKELIQPIASGMNKKLSQVVSGRGKWRCITYRVEDKRRQGVNSTDYDHIADAVKKYNELP